MNNNQISVNNMQDIPNTYQNPTIQNSHYMQMIPKKRNGKNIILVGIICVLIILIAFLLITINSNRNISRTIMIYMVGADLESKSGIATVDLEGIDYSLIDTENVNVVLIAGGTKEWNNNYIDRDETSIYELKDSGFIKVKSQNKQNMGAHTVFTNYLDYVYENYKTDEYDLVFWNHGGAILGSEFDELSGDELSLKDLEKGLSNSKFNDKNRIETVIFRTCLNGTIEMASVFKNHAKYFVASEEITRGISTDNVLGFINNIQKEDSGYDIGKKFIDSYKKQMSSIENLYKNTYGETVKFYSTYSIIDLSKISQLETSINDFFNNIDLNSNYNTIARVRNNLYQYASDTPEYDMVDLYNFVFALKDLSPVKGKKVLDDIENAVLYNWATNSKSRGLSIYFPYNANEEIKKALLRLYDELDSFDKYNSFISKFSSIQASSNKNYSFSNNIIKLEENKEDSDFSLELTEEQKEGYARASYIVFRDNKDGYYLPVYKSNQVELKGNKLLANVKNKQLKVVSTEDSVENILTLFETDVTDEYIKYDTIVTLENIVSDDLSEWNMDTATLSLVYNKKTKQTSIGSVTLNSKNDNSPNGMVATTLDEYTHVVFASSKYKILDKNGNYNENWESNGTIEGIEAKVGKIEFKQQNFDDGYDYYCIFRIYDVDNNYYYSKLVKMK